MKMKQDVTPPGLELIRPGGGAGEGYSPLLWLHRPQVGPEAGSPSPLLGLRRPRVGDETAAPTGRLRLRRPTVGNRFGLFALAILIGGLGLIATAVAAADIRARCDGNTPVILERPAGTEYVKVICNKGIPEFMVEPDAPIPVIDPVKSGRSAAMPTDWGGWVTVWLNGRPLKTPYDPVRAIPEPGAYLAKSTNRVMMPVRFFTEAFQGRVIWDATKREAVLYLQGKQVILQADKAEAKVDGKVVKLDQKPAIFQDRLFVPVRFLLESFNGKVEWDHTNRSARVELVGATCGSPIYCGEVR